MPRPLTLSDGRITLGLAREALEEPATWLRDRVNQLGLTPEDPTAQRIRDTLLLAWLTLDSLRSGLRDLAEDWRQEEHLHALERRVGLEQAAEHDGERNERHDASSAA